MTKHTGKRLTDASDHKGKIMLMAEMTHKLTGEEESDIRGYLEKFGVTGFFARIDSLDLNPKLKEKLNEIYELIFLAGGDNNRLN